LLGAVCSLKGCYLTCLQGTLKMEDVCVFQNAGSYPPYYTVSTGSVIKQPPQKEVRGVMTQKTAAIETSSLVRSSRQVKTRWNASDLSLGGTWFETQPGHLTVLIVVYVVYAFIPGRCRDSI
jgi:hypothetical protein